MYIHNPHILILNHPHIALLHLLQLWYPATHQLPTTHLNKQSDKTNIFTHQLTQVIQYNDPKQDTTPQLSRAGQPTIHIPIVRSLSIWKDHLTQSIASYVISLSTDNSFLHIYSNIKVEKNSISKMNRCQGIKLPSNLHLRWEIKITWMQWEICTNLTQETHSVLILVIAECTLEVVNMSRVIILYQDKLKILIPELSMLPEIHPKLSAVVVPATIPMEILISTTVNHQDINNKTQGL